jgi:hypothetical protein
MRLCSREWHEARRAGLVRVAMILIMVAIAIGIETEREIETGTETGTDTEITTDTWIESAIATEAVIVIATGADQTATKQTTESATAAVETIATIETEIITPTIKTDYQREKEDAHQQPMNHYRNVHPRRHHHHHSDHQRKGGKRNLMRKARYRKKASSSQTITTILTTNGITDPTRIWVMAMMVVVVRKGSFDWKRLTILNTSHNSLRIPRF